MPSTRNITLMFSERLKYLREEQGLTQKELALKMNESGHQITRHMISCFERCYSEPRASQIEAFCDYFKVTPDFMFGYTQSVSNADYNINDCKLLISLKNNGFTKEKVIESQKNINTLLSLIKDEYD